MDSKYALKCSNDKVANQRNARLAYGALRVSANNIECRSKSIVHFLCISLSLAPWMAPTNIFANDCGKTEPEKLSNFRN